MMGYTVPAEHGSDGARLGIASPSPLVLIAALAVVASVFGCNKASNTSAAAGTLDPAFAASGKTIFRYETFGDETFWTDSLHMNQVIQSAVDPTTALKVGLKVDTDSLPPAVVQGIKNGTVDLKSPATTVVLLKLNAVVGVRGTVTTVNGKDQLTRVGITCALCHSTVDNSFAPGIGKRLDGWPNRDLNPGAIIALSPALTPAQKAVYNSWGPGMYDARYNFDGKSAPQAIPPAYGLRGVASVTYTGDGKEIAYWNRYVAVTQMHGHGSFTDSRLTPPENVQNPPDSVTALLPALQEYQLSLVKPAPAAGSFDQAAAARGKAVFNGAGKCATCHVGANFTDAPGRLHPASEVVSEPEPNGGPSLASRSATKEYRTTPLRGLSQHAPYFHNGVAPTLEAVVDLYDTKKGLHLTPAQKADLVQYLKTL
jgi:mono/diheme cytochrome c family protein